MLSKIEAMLADAGRHWNYVHEGMALHMFKIRRIEWCNAAQIHKITVALIVDAKRHGRL